MADLALIEKALRNADAAGDTEAATRLAAAYREAQAAQTPKTSQALGFEQGVGNFIGNFADMAGKVPGVPQLFQALSGHSLDESTAALRNPEHAPGEVPGAIGRFGADVLESAPLAALAPAGLPGTLAAGAVTGAATSDPGHRVAGATLGAGTGGVLHAAGKAIAPQISGAVQRLADNGVIMTPGQIFGGWAKGLEDRAAGVWPLDGWIKGAQRNSLRDFGTGAGNIAMGGIGPIPPGISGQAMSKTAHQIFDDAYGQVLPQLDVTLDGPFAQTVSDAGDRVAARLPAEHSEQFQGTLADVFKKMSAGSIGPSNAFPGRAAKDAYSDLGTMAREFKGPTEDANNRALGDAFGKVQEGLRQSFFNSDPWAAGALNNIDNSYRSFIPVDDAVAKATGNANGLEAGVFTPQQLRQAVVGQDNSVRRTAVSEGGGPLQQYAEDAINVLPSSIGSSGTAERLGLFALPAAAAAASAHPALATAAATVPLLYSKPGLAVLNKMYAHGASPTATALGGIVEQLGRFGAGPAASVFTGNGK
jgi:hypothetical protein